MKSFTFERFAKQNTKSQNGVDVNGAFIAKFGKITLKEAFIIEHKRLSLIFGYFDKINLFEDFLINSDIKSVESNVSESRYYFYNGVKYRFSNHIYPTGSMTSDLCVDLCADPFLIENINF